MCETLGYDLEKELVRKIEQGVWYPGGGFSSVVAAFKNLAQKLGVEIYEGYQVENIEVEYGVASAVIIKTVKQRIPADVIISASGYFGTESIIEPARRSYSDSFWSSKVYSPSSIIVSLGLNTKVPNLLHHNTFSDTELGTEVDVSSQVWNKRWIGKGRTGDLERPNLQWPNL
jgi:phytoene desaturase